MSLPVGHPNADRLERLSLGPIIFLPQRRSTAYFRVVRTTVFLLYTVSCFKSVTSKYDNLKIIQSLEQTMRICISLYCHHLSEVPALSPTLIFITLLDQLYTADAVLPFVFSCNIIYYANTYFQGTISTSYTTKLPPSNTGL